MNQSPRELYIEPTIAWRKWLVDTRDCLLRSLFKDSVWIPGQRFQARCQRDRGMLHASGPSCGFAPNKRCVCGIYAVKSRDELRRYGKHRNPYERMQEIPHTLTVVGHVSLWGRIIETEHGYKAEYAYPYDLIVMRPTNDVLGKTVEQIDRATKITEDVVRGLRDAYLVDVTWE